jgi:hypothetical protein
MSDACDGWFRAAGAEGHCALAALMTRQRAAAPLTVSRI